MPFRRLVAKSLAQQLAPAFEEPCQPPQFGFSRRSGAEEVAHAFQAARQLDPTATGLSAIDHVSTDAMLAALHHVPGAIGAFLFVDLFYGGNLEYVWTDTYGGAHRVVQAEGGEQGDPLMPELFSLAQQLAFQRSTTACSQVRPLSP